MAKRSSQSSRASNKPGWQTTWLWKTIEKRATAQGNNHASAFLPTLTQWMEKLHAIVSSGGTVPLDFTLHDAGHALRVAQRMEQLLTDSARKNLSDYELALLVLAAYGHDVGMTPERKKVQDHHRFLFGHDTGLSADEQQQFQRFIDDYADQPVTLPLSTSLPHLNLADELTAYYVRDRHNDWSGDWLREHMTGGTFGHLPDVTTHLIRLCQSHHWGFDRLEQADFNPFLSTGPQPQLIHLRYLACLLRLADILENDPERTPDVLYRHRSIHERQKSLVHWQKDHALSIDLSDNHITFQARPRNARVHKALEQLADWIDHELHGIAAFGESLPDHRKVGSETIRRQWHLAPALRRDIRPADGAYEYIEGAFRPNTARLLQLLSNEQLYGKPIVAVRELLQNAFDAVREKIARKRLEPHIQDPADRKWEHLLGEQEQVTLTLRPGEATGQWQLVCEDTGVGLTKALITGHLLVSGQSRRHAILELERRCADKGFVLGRTGQFGIGVLSYFMLAQDVQLTTTRYQGCQDSDAAHWQFSTQGVGSFGELKKLPRTDFPTGGTRVEWRLRPDRIEDPTQFAQELFAYLKETLVRIPCRFVFKTEDIPGGDVQWQRPTGWVNTEEDWMKMTSGRWLEPTQLFESDSAYRIRDQQEDWERRKSAYPAELAAARANLRCQFREIVLPGGVGFARLTLQYFDLTLGRCLNARPENSRDTLFGIQTPCLAAWKGMVCQLETTNYRRFIREKIFTIECLGVELDFTAADRALLTTSRDTVVLSPDLAQTWREHLQTEGEAFLDQVLSTRSSELYTQVNLTEQNRPITVREGCGWYHQDAGEYFRPITLPCIALIALPLMGANKKIWTFAMPMIRLRGTVHLNGAEIRGINFSQESKGHQQPCLYWPNAQDKRPTTVTLFPLEWQQVAWLDLKMFYRASDPMRKQVVVNPTNPLIQLLSEENRVLISSCHYEGLFSLNELDSATTAQQAAFAFLALARKWTDNFDKTQWQGYLEQRADHLLYLWQLIGQAIHCDWATLRLFVVGADADFLLSPSEYSHNWRTFMDDNLLPRITAPDRLLYADDLPAE